MNQTIAAAMPAKPASAPAFSLASIVSSASGVASSYSSVGIQPGPPQALSTRDIERLQKKCDKGLLGKCKKIPGYQTPLPPEEKTVICSDGCGSTYETTGSCRPQQPCDTGIKKPGGGTTDVIPGKPWCDLFGVGCGPGDSKAPDTPSTGGTGTPPGPTIDNTDSLIDLFGKFFGGQISAGSPVSSGGSEPGVLVMPANQTSESSSSSSSPVKAIVILLAVAAVTYFVFKYWKKHKG